MMARIKRVFAAAAALVVAGATVAVALHQAGQAEGMTCADWARAVPRLAAETSIYYIAAPSGATPPAAVGDKLIGNCAAGECTVVPQGCPFPIKYTYELTGAITGTRVFRVQSHPYFAAGLKEWAEQTAGAKFLGGMPSMLAKCRESFTNAKCLQLAGLAHQCWLQPDGTLCRYGRTYRINGPGQPGDGFCTPQATATPFPCDELERNDLDAAAMQFPGGPGE